MNFKKLLLVCLFVFSGAKIYSSLKQDDIEKLAMELIQTDNLLMLQEFLNNKQISLSTLGALLEYAYSRGNKEIIDYLENLYTIENSKPKKRTKILKLARKKIN